MSSESIEEQPIVTQNSYSISKIKKLIDLNHDMINFKVLFNISSPDDQQFQALIVNQSTLDSVESDKLEYKTVQGSLSGEVVADKNVYQNYYVILKSDVPIAIDVELQTTKLPDYIEHVEKKPKKEQESSSQNDNVKYILMGIGVMVVLYFIMVKMNEGKGSGGGGSLPKSGMHQSLLTKLKKISLE